jgi:hypothetical protein
VELLPLPIWVKKQSGLTLSSATDAKPPKDESFLVQSPKESKLPTKQLVVTLSSVKNVWRKSNDPANGINQLKAPTTYVGKNHYT